MRPRNVLRATVSMLAALSVVQLPLLASPPGTPSAEAASGTPGAATAGDSLFPSMGNGGYDVTHYGISLTWYPRGQSIGAVDRVQATATQALSSFDLDLLGLTVRSVTVNGTAASFSQSGHKLVIRPASAIADGAGFTAVITYGGVPHYYVDPDGSHDGWIPTTDGATVLAEPVGAMTWFPVNNTPRDKATYNVSVSVPNGTTAVSNGVLTSTQVGASRTVWNWAESRPMANYLATVSIGRFTRYTGTTSTGVPLDSYIDPTLGSLSTARQQIPLMLNQMQSWFGPYPFEVAGIIADSVPNGYDLETQTRPVMMGDPPQSHLLHELSHSWYGDSVTIRDWGDIWLNEGFARYANWLWTQHVWGTTPSQQFTRTYNAHPASDPYWQLPPGAPRQRQEPVQAAGLRPGRDDAGGVAVDSRGRHLLHHPATVGGATPVLLRQHGWVPLPRRADLRQEAVAAVPRLAVPQREAVRLLTPRRAGSGSPGGRERRLRAPGRPLQATHAPPTG